MSFRTGFLVRNPVFGKRRSLASLRDDKSLNHQNFPDTVLVHCQLSFASLTHVIPNRFFGEESPRAEHEIPRFAAE